MKRVCGLILFFAILLLPAMAAEPYAPTRLTVSGSHYEMGKEIGLYYKEQIRMLGPGFESMAALAGGVDAQALHRRAIEMAKALAPEDLDEIRGIADGAELPYETVLFVNLFYSIMEGKMACRQIAAWDDETEDGRLLHARNLDWHDYPGKPLTRNHVILTLRPDGGKAMTLLTWPGYVGALTGSNEAGLTMAFNKLKGSQAKGEKAEATFFTIKRALRDCDSLDKAIELFEKSTPLDNGSILISDNRARTAAVIETYQGEVGVRRAREDMIGNANHYTTDAGIQGVRTSSATWPTCDAARKIEVKFGIQEMKAIMRSESVLQSHNLLSVIFDPANNRMYLSSGASPAAGTVPYQSFFIFEELMPTAIE
ncbi:MAG: C45 family autoproteolytic acyltransferase/hydrolase [Candidatus Sumerlaeia bacterium]